MLKRLEHNFLLLVVGQFISLMGSGLTSFALGVWVYQQNQSMTQYALISTFSLLPSVFLSPILGTLIDRWNRRTTLIISDMGASVSLLVVPMLLYLDMLSVWQIYVCVFVSSIFASMRWTALSVSITTMVSEENYSSANGTLQLVNSISLIATPFLSSILFSKLKLAGIIYLDAVSFVISILMLLAVVFPPFSSQDKLSDKSSFWKETLFGWRYLKQRKFLLFLLVLMAVANLNIGFIQALITPLILSISNVKVLGQVMSIAAFGALAGSVYMTLFKKGTGKLNLILISGILQGFILIIGGISTNVFLIGTAAFLFMFLSAFILINIQTIWQKSVEVSVQGRVFGFRTMIALASAPVAYAVAGPLAERVFNPLLQSDGPLVDSLGGILGEGPTRGVGLFFILIGLLMLLTMGFCLVNSRIQKLANQMTPPETTNVNKNDQLKIINN